MSNVDYFNRDPTLSSPLRISAVSLILHNEALGIIKEFIGIKKKYADFMNSYLENIE